MRDLSREQLLAELRALRPEFERRGVTGLSLFGSRARGDNRPDSDVDIVVDFAKNARFSLLEVVGLGQFVEDRLGIETNIFIREDFDPSFQRTFKRDGILIFEPEPVPT